MLHFYILAIDKDMAKGPSLLGIWVLVGCSLLLLAAVYGTSEGFADAVPDVCGKYGWTLSSGVLSILQQLHDLKLMGNYPETILDVSKRWRQYTPADCDKLGGTYYQTPNLFPYANVCMKLKDPTQPMVGANIAKPFFTMCNGLNSQRTPGPVECSANGKPLGVPNKGLSIVYEGKNIIIPDGTVQLYTKAECDTLQGNLLTVSSVEQEYKLSRERLAGMFQLKVDDVNKFLQLNGETVGACVSKDATVVYSLACAATGSPSMLQTAWTSVVGT